MECGSQGLRKGTWTAEEDSLLRKCIEKYGEGKWHQVPSRAGLNRCRKSCRLRWLNYLNPNIKRGKLSPDEVDLVIRLHKLLGNRWSLIAGRLPGRTANDIKNYWNTHLSKKQDQSTCKNINSTSKPVRKIDVIKPRPRSFSTNGQDPMPEITLQGSNNKYDNNNTDDNHCNENVLDGNKTCDRDVNEITNVTVDDGKKSMWWERLLEEGEEVVEWESSWMNSAATTSFDVNLWDLFDA